MQVRFWGTRGSIPKPGPATLRHGGNTSCLEVVTGSGALIVLDAGTGAHDLGHALTERLGPKMRGHLLITHTHWDHIQGLPFFAPLWMAGGEWDIYAPRDAGHTLREILSAQMQAPFFPVKLADMRATIRFHALEEGRFEIEGVRVQAQMLHHAAPTLGYRLEADGAAVVYACDHEPFDPGLAGGLGQVRGADARHADFLAGADLVVHDAQYTAAEYPGHAGWGHGTHEYAARMAALAGVGTVAMTHHDPNRSDAALDVAMAGLQAGPFGEAGVRLVAAAEGDVFELGRV